MIAQPPVPTPCSRKRGSNQENDRQELTRATAFLSRAFFMRAIIFDAPGDETVLRLADVPAPMLGPEEVRLRVLTTAINRADLMQRQGKYPPPSGASPILGLECCGIIIERGGQVTDFAIGERVMALLTGGGYATEVTTPAATLMRVPESFTDAEAGAFPEAFLTAYSNIFMIGRAVAPQAVLIHGGGSGVGTAAVSMCTKAGLTTFATAGSDAKGERLARMGAIPINYNTQDFVAVAQEKTNGAGVDIVLDCIGASYLARNLRALKIGGRLVLIGLMGGSQAEINLGLMLTRRLELLGSALRSRPVAEKAAIIAALYRQFGSEIHAGRLRPVVHCELLLEQAADAHRMMRASQHFGKIVLHAGQAG